MLFHILTKKSLHKDERNYRDQLHKILNKSVPPKPPSKELSSETIIEIQKLSQHLFSLFHQTIAQPILIKQSFHLLLHTKHCHKH